MNKKLHTLKLIIPSVHSSSLVIHFDNLQEKQLWERHIKQIINWKDVHDYYKFGEDLGKGQFGVVRLAKDIQSG